MVWEGTPRKLANQFLSMHDQETSALRDRLREIGPGYLGGALLALNQHAQDNLTARLARWAVNELFTKAQAEIDGNGPT